LIDGEFVNCVFDEDLEDWDIVTERKKDDESLLFWLGD
jgi:hypothetical protein